MDLEENMQNGDNEEKQSAGEKEEAAILQYMKTKVAVQDSDLTVNEIEASKET